MSQQLPEAASLDQLRIQAKELLKSLRAGDPDALERIRPCHPGFRDGVPARIALADAQLVLAREYGFANWPRLKAHVELGMLKAQLETAVRGGDLAETQRLARLRPSLLRERIRNCDGGTALSLAAQWGHLEMVRWLRAQPAGDPQHALSRASMRAHREVMEYLMAAGSDPNGPYAAGMEQYGPVITAVCEVQNAQAMAILLEHGARLTWRTPDGMEHNPVSMLIATYGREPLGKAECLEVCAQAGFELPDTPVMALHRRRWDLLEAHLRREPSLLARQFTEAEVYPPTLGIGPGEGLHMASINGATLLHLATEFHDGEMMEWLLRRGADPNARTAIDAEGFGGHTPLFHATVALGRKDAELARVLLDHGADPNRRATIRKALVMNGDAELEQERRFYNVTPVGFARQFQWARGVNQAAVELLLKRGGVE